jgi:Ran GTPase-activating protein (RanGAP) involved in mRNA processing and transport
LLLCGVAIPTWNAMSDENSGDSSDDHSVNYDLAKQLSEGDGTSSKNHPFVESKSKIEDGEIAGLLIGKNKVTFFSYDKRYFEEPFNQGENFADQNFFKKFSKLMSADFSGIELTKDRLENMQKFLPKNLQCFGIDCCKISDELVELVSDIVQKRSDIKHLTIMLPEVNSDGAKSITSAMAGFSGLQSLNLVFDAVTKKSCADISKLIETSPQMETLSLGWSNIDDNDEEDSAYKEIGENIGKLKILKRFELSIMNVDGKACSFIFGGIKPLEELMRLKLFFGNISVFNGVKLFERSEELTDSLANKRKLTSLDLSYMSLPKDAMQVITQNVGSLVSLKCLDLSGNPIDNESASLLAESLKNLQQLEVLIMNKCSLNEQTFSTICKSLDNSQLKVLYVSNNDIKSGIRGFQLKTMESIQVIDFSYNNIPIDASIDFIKSIADNPNLQAVNFEGNVTTEIADKNKKASEEDKDKIIKERIIIRDKIESFKRKNRIYTAIFGL